MAKTLIQRIFQGRLSAPSTIREVLQIPKAPLKYTFQTKRHRRPPKYIKGVNNGYYFRIKIPPKRNPLPSVPKLPTTNPMPKPFKAPPPKVLQATDKESASKYEGYSKRLFEWLKPNLPIIILNIGSICTLVGFTRSDILELRTFSITGNIMFVFYNLGQKTILWPSIAWSSLFAAVNGFKIFEILHERNAEVHMTEKQEEVFVEHFMPHGITPKQFERIEHKATKSQLKKGEFLIRKGQQLDHLYLIIEGSTRAHILGRQITAASTNPDTKGGQKAGGDSGAWAGEMAFLDSFWEKEQGKKKSKSNDPEEFTKKGYGLAIYTILADADCTVLSWSHEDMAELMRSSTDLRAALTRAMTSALVGKVVNLSVSRTQSGIPNWSTWLSDWNNNYGAKVQVRNVQKLAEDRREDSAATKPAPPIPYPDIF
jgi:CRP-like cAMP-binding protein